MRESNAETRDWIYAQAGQQADAYCQATGEPTTLAQRDEIQSRVRRAFREKYGSLMLFFWAIQIARIVYAVLDALYGVVGSKRNKPQKRPPG